MEFALELRARGGRGGRRARASCVLLAALAAGVSDAFENVAFVGRDCGTTLRPYGFSHSRMVPGPL